MLPFLTPKPPVPAVPNASKLASNKFKPPNRSKIIKTIEFKMSYFE